MSIGCDCGQSYWLGTRGQVDFLLDFAFVILEVIVEIDLQRSEPICGRTSSGMVSKGGQAGLDCVISIFKNFDLFQSQINPEHTIPTLDDGGQVIWDSHAICSYLVDKYAKDDSLYPKDLFLRAKCNQRLFFANSILYVRLRNASVAIFFGGATETSKDKINAILEAYDLLEAMLVDDFLVGNALTIADICAMVEITSLDEIYAPVSSDKYPRIAAWLDRIKTLPFYDEMNGKHVNEYKALLTHHLETNKNRVVQQEINFIITMS